MLVELVLAAALQAHVESQPTRFELAGAHIGMPYADLRKSFPSMTCNVSCVDKTATHAGESGRLWVGIGNSVVNQLVFIFEPSLNNMQTQTIRQLYISKYGRITHTTDDCEVWRRASGKIVLCLRGDKPYTYWDDENFMRATSVIPGA